MNEPASRRPSPMLEELHLLAFKSFRGASLSLSELTLLIGKNGSGKSNAIDGLTALGRLAEGDDIRDALDGARADSEPIRGGADGCAPYGEDAFELGCKVRSGDAVLTFQVGVQVRPELQIRYENLWVESGVTHGRRRLDGRALLATDSPAERSGDLIGRWFNGKQGIDPSVQFARNRLLLTQVPTRVPADTEAARLVQMSARAVRAALRSVFILDPIPHLMRQYVNARDSDLRRNADNLSAAVAALSEESPDEFRELESLLQAMPDRPFSRIAAARSDLGDVLVALAEPGPSAGTYTVPARLMSDGMLRFLAVGTALLSAPRTNGVAGNGSDEADTGQRLLVVEEVENGLHPVMAARVVDLIRRQSERRRIRTLVTTHSPALLDALQGHDHRGVVVCDRDPSGYSRLARLVDLPGYPSMMAMGTLGDVVGRGLLTDAAEERRPISPRFAELLGGL